MYSGKENTNPYLPPQPAAGSSLFASYDGHTGRHNVADRLHSQNAFPSLQTSNLRQGPAYQLYPTHPTWSQSATSEMASGSLRPPPFGTFGMPSVHYQTAPPNIQQPINNSMDFAARNPLAGTYQATGGLTPGSALAFAPQRSLTWVDETPSGIFSRSPVRANLVRASLDRDSVAQNTNAREKHGESAVPPVQPQKGNPAARNDGLDSRAQARRDAELGTAANSNDDNSGGDENSREPDSDSGGMNNRRYGWMQNKVIPASTWADRNPGKMTQPVRRSVQNTAERRAQKMRSQTIQDNMRKLQDDVAAVQEFCRMRACEIAKQHSKKVPYIEKLITSSSAFKPPRRVNLRNAIIHHKAKELNHGRPQGERLSLADIRKAALEYLDNNEITEEQKAELIEELNNHRELKRKGLRATNLAAAQDSHQTFMRLSNELDNLTARTGAIGFIYMTRSHIHDKTIPSWYSTGEGGLFIRECFKKDPNDVLQLFELWACTRDQVGVKTDTLLSMRTECSELIAEGLQSITKNKKAIMNYASYDRSIVQKYHVKLVGWPPGIPFSSPHNICTVDEVRALRHLLQEKTCYWRLMTDQEVTEHMRSTILRETVQIRKRKVRSDKGKQRNVVAKYSRGSTSKKRKNDDRNRRQSMSRFKTRRHVIVSSDDNGESSSNRDDDSERHSSTDDEID